MQEKQAASNVTLAITKMRATIAQKPEPQPPSRYAKAGDGGSCPSNIPDRE